MRKPRPTRPRIPTPDGIPFAGLTGGIGAGKSTALNALEGLGCAVLSADAVVHEIQSSAEVVSELVGRFGFGVAPSGKLDRQALAEAAFADEDSRAWLERLIWPRVGSRIAEWSKELGDVDPRPRLAVVEVPLLFESGMDAAFDTTICVTASEPLRRERAEARGHAALDERAARQLSPAEKEARAEWTVTNNGSVSELEVELEAVISGIEAKA